MKETETPLPPVEIPPDQISGEARVGIIESFILREGTDYGREEMELSKKREQIEKQISRGEIKIVFDPNTESVTLMTKQDWEKFNRPH